MSDKDVAPTPGEPGAESAAAAARSADGTVQPVDVTAKSAVTDIAAVAAEPVRVAAETPAAVAETTGPPAAAAETPAAAGTPATSATTAETAAATTRTLDTVAEASASRPGDDTKDDAAEKKSRTPRITVPAPGRAARLAGRAVVLLALVAAIAAAGFFYHRDHEQRQLADAEQQARTAACKYAPVLANYDAKNLDAYFAAVLDGATGDWHKQFDSTSKDLRDVLTQGQVVSKATDVQCAIRSNDRDSAEAIVVIGQTITSLGTQGKPAPGQLSMVMRLQRSGDHWLVDKVNSPLAPPPQS
ncbi:hypothetical protein [Nocardia sp. alder85J]|uniref:hypothetical protein n=1 Tax=Nocardia sp. alder85J TaxID=2862949 RepID=UPI001CD1D3A0|nr:hypothetical protein [Nocardia sp. alder85J]MCX4098215.1 hypothetical protein [Nocardia sp. alder85J]